MAKGSSGEGSSGGGPRRQEAAVLYFRVGMAASFLFISPPTAFCDFGKRTDYAAGWIECTLRFEMQRQGSEDTARLGGTILTGWMADYSPGVIYTHS